MPSSPRIDDDTLFFLENEYHRRFPSGPRNREDQSLTDRVRRSISWLKRVVRVSQDDLPPRFVELWIALNALYGQQTYEKRSRLTEEDYFSLFMGSLVQLDMSERQLPATMKRIGKRVKGLVKNKYLWIEFWRRDPAKLERNIKEETQTLEDAVRCDDVATFFTCAVKRLLILRNQLVHGSSSENTTKNEDAIKPGLLILEEMIPVFLLLLIRHGAGKDLPPLPFPGKHTLQFPE